MLGGYKVWVEFSLTNIYQMARGGYRPGGGRKSKAEELGIANLIEDVIGDAGKKAIVKKLYDMAIKGSFPHHQLLMYYTFGKPTDKIQISGDMDNPLTYLTPVAFVKREKKT
jgi:hypothetical protein